MYQIKQSVSSLYSVLSSQSKKDDNKVTILDLQKIHLTNVVPRDYQIYGINWLGNCYKCRNRLNGVILGDEMGLGKTIQSIAFLVHQKHRGYGVPTLILCPLSVVDGWRKEFSRCAPSLKVQLLIGTKEERENTKKVLTQNIQTNFGKHSEPAFDILLLSYEVCIKEEEFLKKFNWNVLIVDEAHRLKNSKSILYQLLLQFNIDFKLLLTGTPVQNNLSELFSLLSFVSPQTFPLKLCDDFTSYFNCVNSDSSVQQELHELIKPFLLRRTKMEVIPDLPNKSEVVLYCHMSTQQKQLYKAILMKDFDAFTNKNGPKTRLMNILMQLRKCCNHPYIFPGIEPEPFEIGEHLVDASGKLNLLDKLLTTLKQSHHKVLLFSQMTTMLDIVQDYLGYRGYSYERLDGSVRGEERFLAVNQFNKTEETFLFLLSTRAGGQGLNLVSADTVIFLDSDFNPQQDLQAAARVHRIGQTRPVKIIRMVTKNTVEEIILNRANSKLHLTDAVIEGGQFSNISSRETQLTTILQFGLDGLFQSDDQIQVHFDFERILGKSKDGRWLQISSSADHLTTESQREERPTENMYVYEGEDYSKVDSSVSDKTILKGWVQALTGSSQVERSSRKAATNHFHIPLPESLKRKRRELTEEEKAARKQKIIDNKAKRFKMAVEEKKAKLKRLWLKNDYKSSKVEIPDDVSDAESDVSTDDDVQFNDSDGQEINYVVGDVTEPEFHNTKHAVVVHCVDDSGYWGNGGLFTAIDNHSSLPQHQYELAGRMKDLSVGDVHLMKIKDKDLDKKVSVALIVAYTRDEQNQLSPLLMNYLLQGLENLYHIGKDTQTSIHFPRIGYNSPQFNWYGIEKMIKKTLAQRNVPTYIYYFQRNKGKSKMKRKNEECLQSIDDIEDLPDVFSNCVVFISVGDEKLEKQLARYVIAFDGDVEKCSMGNTTHVVCTDDLKKTLVGHVDDSCKFVTKEWIEDSVKTRKLQDESFYFV